MLGAAFGGHDVEVVRMRGGGAGPALLGVDDESGVVWAGGRIVVAGTGG